MDKKENFECISAEQAYKLAQNANITDNMFHAIEIADYCKNKLASKKTLDDIEKTVLHTVYYAGLLDGVRKERAKRKDKTHQKFLELEMNTTELEISLEKLRLLTNDLREYYFCFDENKKPENVLYYYNSASIKCDIVIDYILEMQAIANNIDCLTYAILGKASHS